MNTTEKIVHAEREIEECIKYLMLVIKKRLGEKREKTFLDKEKVERHRKDSRFPLKLQMDELPFFALYVNLKKAVYENLIFLCHKRNDLEEDDYKVLGDVGIMDKNGELQFKSLKDFVTKPNGYMDLNLNALENYLDAIESCLLFSTASRVIQAILIKFEMTGSYRQYYSAVADGTLTNIFDENEAFEDELDMLKQQNRWYSYYVDTYKAKYSDNFMLPHGEIIGNLFLQIKGIECAETIETRQSIVKAITKRNFIYFCSTVNTVLKILANPAYDIPPDVLLNILNQTLTGMRRTVFARKLKEYTLGKDRRFSKGELMVAFGVRSEKFAKQTAIYGDKTFSEDEIKAALDKLGQPLNLFDLKII